VDAGGKWLHAVNRVGHQGLFFERFDGSYTDPTLAEGGLPSLGPTGKAIGLYYNRNRFYHPLLGRFLTRDPNETGMPTIAAMAMNGEALDLWVRRLDAEALFGNGMNVYLYCTDTPVNNGDPLGLADETMASMLSSQGMIWLLFGASVTAVGCDYIGHQVQSTFGNAGGDLIGDFLSWLAAFAAASSQDPFQKRIARYSQSNPNPKGGDWKPEDIWQKFMKAARKITDAIRRKLGIERIDVPRVEQMRNGSELPHAHGDGWAVNIDGTPHDNMPLSAIPEAAKAFLRTLGFVID
jgi:hypothetical protein